MQIISKRQLNEMKPRKNANNIKTAIKRNETTQNFPKREFENLDTFVSLKPSF